MRPILMSLALISTTSFGQAKDARTIHVPRTASALVIPILDAMDEAIQHQPIEESEGSPFWRASTLLGRLFANHTRPADEALVVLFSYYLGESNGEDLIAETVNRGRRMLPFLRRYQHRDVHILGKNYSELTRRQAGAHDSLFDEAIKEIEATSGK